MNPNKALWEKGDFTRIAASMRESGEALVGDARRSPRGSRSSTSAAATGPPRCRRRSSGADVLGVDIAANLVAAGNARAQSLGLANLRFQEGDASDLDELDDERFDLVVSIFGAMFAPKPVRRGQGDGARDPARRPDRDGQLDPQRPDPGRADPEDQRRLLAAASRGLRQPDDLGRGGRRDRAVRRRRQSRRATSRSSGTPTRSTIPAPPSELVATFRSYYGPTMNAFEAAAANGREARAPAASWRPCSTSRTRADDATSIPATFLRVTVAR